MRSAEVSPTGFRPAYLVTRLALPLALTVAFGWWAFRDVDAAALRDSVAQAQLLWLLPSSATFVLIHLLRTWRWHRWLTAFGGAPFREVHRATAVGNLLFLALPLRLGEFARPLLISRRAPISFPEALTSIVAERIADGLCLAAMVWGLLAWFPETHPSIPSIRLGANLTFALFFGALVVMVLLRARAAARLPFLRRYVEAARRLPPIRPAIGFLAATALIWIATGVGYWLCAAAFRPLGLTLFDAFLVVGVTAIATVIPAAPGMAGTYHAGVRLALSLVLPAGLIPGVGMAYTSAAWLVVTLTQVLIGLVWLPTVRRPT